MPFQLKVVFAGSSGVGKTAIINALQNKPFIPNNSLTIAGGAVPISVMHQGDPISLLVWDTAGQEKYRAIIPIYFNNAVVIVVVYAITDRDSFESVAEWIALSRESAPASARVILIGNKHDLADSRAVTCIEGEEKHSEADFFAFRETSALTGEGIPDLLLMIADAAARSKAYTESEYMEEPVSYAAGEDPRREGCC
jgi:small GTP-binding protein